MTQHDADALIECIYDAVTDEAALHALPCGIAALAGGESCFTAINYGDRSFDYLCDYGMDAEFIPAYARRIAAQDPWEPIPAGLPHNRFHNMDRHLSPRDLPRTVLFEEMPRAIGEHMRHITAATLDLPGGVAVISTQRSAARGAFGDDVERRLQPYIPHLRRLMLARHTLAAARCRLSDSYAMFDCLPGGVLQVDAAGAVLYANAAAAELLQCAAGKGDGLVYSGARKLGAHFNSDGARLHETIAKACSGLDGGALLIRRCSGAAPLQVVITPFRSRLPPRPLSALILIEDPARSPAGLDKVLMQLYGLSRGESQLAIGLARGSDLAELAGDRSVSMHTVRTILRRALSKTGLRKQSALAGLVGRIAVPRK